MTDTILLPKSELESDLNASALKSKLTREQEDAIEHYVHLADRTLVKNGGTGQTRQQFSEVRDAWAALDEETATLYRKMLYRYRRDVEEGREELENMLTEEQAEEASDYECLGKHYPLHTLVASRDR